MNYGSDDWQTDEIGRLKNEIWHLQERLDRYHEWLEQSLDHDRRFQLGAIWGPVSALVGAGAAAAVLYATNNWFQMSGWIAEILTGIAVLVAYFLGAAWAEKGREGDLKKLSRLPQWDKDFER